MTHLFATVFYYKIVNIIKKAICLFTGAVVCVLMIILRLAASNFLDENVFFMSYDF